jgi:hypothetical protein
MLGVTAAVAVVAAEFDVALVIEQPVKDLQGFACRRPPDPWGRSRRSRWTLTKAKKLVLKSQTNPCPLPYTERGRVEWGSALVANIHSL